MNKKLTIDNANVALEKTGNDDLVSGCINESSDDRHIRNFPMTKNSIEPKGNNPNQLSLFQSSPTPLPLNAYLACALTGLEDQARQTIFKISDLIAEICEDNNIDLYQPRKSTDPVEHKDISAIDVYQNDKARVLASDLLVHLCHYPSTGAGAELEFARAALLPILLVSPNDIQISRMVLGIPSLQIEIRYDSFDSLQSQLQNALFDLLPLLEARKLAFSKYKVNLVGNKILEIRQKQNLTRSEVSQASNNLTEGRISEIETKCDLESNPSLVELREIATILKTTVSEVVEPNFARQVLIELKAWTEGREAARDFISADDQKKMLKALLHRMADNL